jgi:hypothetical protein
MLPMYVYNEFSSRVGALSLGVAGREFESQKPTEFRVLLPLGDVHNSV